MQLSVFGLGHAGSVAAGCLAAHGHDVITFDQDPGKTHLIRRGMGPVREPGLDALIAEGIGAGKLSVAADIAGAVENSALSNIFSPASYRPQVDRDLADLTGLCRQIGLALAAKTKFHSVVFRTPLSPGVTRGVLIPALERASGKRASVDFGVAVYPTFLRHGTAIQDCINPSAILVGVTDDETLARLREMDIALQAPELVVDLAEAEAMSRAGTAWRAPSESKGKERSPLAGFAVAAPNLGSC
jgi:GDP-mannose 6-dehydrogenase